VDGNPFGTNKTTDTSVRAGIDGETDGDEGPVVGVVGIGVGL
jgi:hypothetical protein